MSNMIKSLWENMAEKGGEDRTKKAITSIRREFVVRNLRAQVNRLNDILLNIEFDDVDSLYISESLKAVEENLRRTRKLIADNQGGY